MLTFRTANLALFMAQVGFSILTVLQSYALDELENEELPFQLYKSVIGMGLFLIYLTITEEDVMKNFREILSVHMRPFLICSISLAALEIGIICAISWLGPSIFAIGITSAGSVSYGINMILGKEYFSLKKVSGAALTILGAAFATIFCWIYDDSSYLFEGSIAIIVVIFGCYGYYETQKELYVKFSVVFVAASTFIFATLIQVLVAACAQSFSLRTDTSTILILAYSSICGNFLFYIWCNAANEVLSSSLVILYGGLQPTFTPFLDIVRTCYFPKVDDEDQECSVPYWILAATAIVILGLVLYSLDERDILKSNMNYGTMEEEGSSSDQKNENDGT